MSNFEIEVLPEGGIALQAKSHEDFFNVVREVIAGRIGGASVVYFTGRERMLTWYLGEKHSRNWELGKSWEWRRPPLPSWVLEG